MRSISVANIVVMKAVGVWGRRNVNFAQHKLYVFVHTAHVNLESEALIKSLQRNENKSCIRRGVRAR
eukprot:scaffold94141_cov44-Tisochrysis_lutea.AAC.1